MYLSYSGWKQFEDCNLAYWLSYIGRIELPDPDDRLNSIFGSVTGALFEDFFNLKLWKQPMPQGYLASRVEATVDRIIQQETTPTKFRSAGVVKWKDGTPEGNPKGAYRNRAELIQDVMDAIPKGFKTIKHDRLLGPVAQAEVRLDTTIDGHKIGGRADFVIRRTRPHNDLVIADGKGSKHRDAYVDVTQLRWYDALLRRHSKWGTPDRLGFIYWRFEPPESTDWFDSTRAEADALLARVLQSIAKIEKLTRLAAKEDPKAIPSKVFLPIVEDLENRAKAEQSCRFCSYADPATCPSGYEFRKASSRKRR